MNAPAFAAPAALSSCAALPSPHALSSRCQLTSPLVVPSPARRASVSMISETNLAKKALKVDAVRKRLASCQMLFAADVAGLTVKDIGLLKRAIPETTTVMTVKNTLMRRAIEDTEWAGVGDFIKDSNMWFFVDEDFKGSVAAYEGIVKTLKREPIKGGVFEGETVDGKAITSIAALPSKQELIAKIAISINMVPTKLGRSVKAVPSKLARAVKLAVAEEGDADGPAAE